MITKGHEIQTLGPPPAYPTETSAPSQAHQWHAQPGPNVPPPPVIIQPPKTPAQIGEQYRAEQFALCAQGLHETTTKYGVCGIISCILLFPIGLICLFADTEQLCTRCGKKL